jgi:hypothetical protein
MLIAPEPLGSSMASEKKTVSASAGKTFATIVNLWPYMWPSDRADLKLRVALATLFLVLSKLVLLSVPYFFKWSTDALSGGLDPLKNPLPYALGAITLVAAYNLARVIQAGFNQLRDTLFASVGQHAVRQLAYKTFLHLHQLSLRFHLERRTGGLSRVIERGTKGIETIVRFVILNTMPTLFELCRHPGLDLWHRLFRSDRDHGRRLCDLHHQGQQLADRYPPIDEFLRCRGQFQGNRLAVELRDGEVFRQRSDGGQALRPIDGTL